MAFQITNKRFILRALQSPDAFSLAKHANNQKIEANLTDVFPFPYTPSDANNFILAKKNETPIKTFAIVIDGKAVGVISISPRVGIYRITAEIGYWIGESFWGQGIMNEAIKEILNYTFVTFPEVLKIVAFVYDFNIGSAKALEKAGFELESISRKAAIKNENVCDILNYVCFK